MAEIDTQTGEIAERVQVDQELAQKQLELLRLQWGVSDRISTNRDALLAAVREQVWRFHPHWSRDRPSMQRRIDRQSRLIVGEMLGEPVRRHVNE